MTVEVVNSGKRRCFISFVLLKEAEEIKYMYLNLHVVTCRATGFYILLLA